MTLDLLYRLLLLVWIDLLLSGDNAVVIALVCRGLPPSQQRLGLLLGAGAAIALRIVFAGLITVLLDLEGLRIVGGLVFLWVAAKLLFDEGDDEAGVRQPTGLWAAVGLIALADASMSLDNVLALAALARGNFALLALGVALSIPFVIAGAAVIKAVVDRAPWLVWFGAGLLGWVAGTIIVDDPWLQGWLQTHLPPAFVDGPIPLDWWAGALGVIIVLAAGALHRWPERNPAV